MNTQINCKHCNGLRRAEVIANIILDTCINSEVKCCICDTIHIITYAVTNFVRKHRKERPLIQEDHDEQVEYGGATGRSEH